jgi:hypothetical protein
MKKNMNYKQLKREMIKALKKSIEEQNAGRIGLNEVGYDNLDHAVPRNDGPEFDKLINALYFWDCWIDSSNHNWLYHGDLQPGDWIKLANLIVVDLEADREIIDHLQQIH